MNENFKYENFPSPFKNQPIPTVELSLLEMTKKSSSPRVIARRFSTARIAMIVLAGLGMTGLTIQNFDNPREVKGAPLAGPTYEWKDGSRLSCPRSDMASAATDEGDVFSFGGSGGKGADCSPSTYLNVTEKRDRITGNWTIKNEMPVSIRNASATYINPTKIAVIGGEIVKNFVVTASDEVWFYNPQTDTWSAGPTLDRKVQGHESVKVGNKIFVAGGTNENGATVDKTSIINIDTNTVSAGPKMQMPRTGFAMAKDSNENVHIFGGNIGSGGTTSAEKFDPTLTSSVAITPLDIEIYNLGAGFFKESNEFILAGGTNNDASGAFNDTRIYSLTNGTYRIGPKNLAAREFFGIQAIGINKVLVFGGDGNEVPSVLNSSEIASIVSDVPTPTNTVKPVTSTPSPTKTPDKSTPTNTPFPTSTPNRPVSKLVNNDLVLPALAINSNKITQP